MSDDDPNPDIKAVDPTAEGSRARAKGRDRDACPYAADTEERHEWLEGYDGRDAQGSELTAASARGSDADRT
jgi:ribosome modulation factor